MILFDVPETPVFRTCGTGRLPRVGGLPRMPSCGRTLSIESFDKLAGSAGRRRPVCNTCRKLWEYYRISHDFWQELAARQRGACAIVDCGTPVVYGSGVAGAHVDHDHRCQHPGKGKYSCPDCVRGLLCASCNTAIGYIERNPQRVQGWVDYLAKRAVPCR